MGDVGERSAVNEGGHRFGGLDEIGQDRLVENGGHRADHATLLGEHRLAVLREADQDPIEPRPQIGRRAGQAEDGHDLAGRRDVEAGLSRHALRPSAQADDDVPQGRSFMSRTHFQSTLVGSRLKSRKWMWLSIVAASRLWAEVIA